MYGAVGILQANARLFGGEGPNASDGDLKALGGEEDLFTVMGSNGKEEFIILSSVESPLERIPPVLGSIVSEGG